MIATTLLPRLRGYYLRHGMRAALRRALEVANHVLFSRRSVLYYLNLADYKGEDTKTASSVTVERIKRLEQLSDADMRRVLGLWNPEIAGRQVKERFARGAWLWLVRVEREVVGYGWTLAGGTMEPHFFNMAENDVHLFDYYIAPEFRGRGLNPLLVKRILSELAALAFCRAFIETAEWNGAQLASLEKTPFRRLGYASKLTFRTCTLVRWTRE